jgi:hypothetical protein
MLALPLRLWSANNPQFPQPDKRLRLLMTDKGMNMPFQPTDLSHLLRLLRL